MCIQLTQNARIAGRITLTRNAHVHGPAFLAWLPYNSGGCRNVVHRTAQNKNNNNKIRKRCSKHSCRAVNVNVNDNDVIIFREK